MEILLPEDYFLPKLQLRPATAKQEHSQSRPGSPAALEESRSPKRRGLNWRGRLAANLSGGGSGSDSELGSNAGSDASGSPPERPFLLARYADAYSDASSSETDSPVSAGMTLLDPSSIHVSATPSTGLLPRGRDNHSSSSGSPDMRDTSQSNTATLPAQWSSAPQQQVEASEATVQALGAVQHFAGQSSVDWAGRQQYERESEAKPAALRQELHRDAVAAAKETAAQASLGERRAEAVTVACRHSWGRMLLAITPIGVMDANVPSQPPTALDRLRAATAGAAAGRAGDATAGRLSYVASAMCC